jgi:hypothetical protein
MAAGAGFEGVWWQVLGYRLSGGRCLGTGFTVWRTGLGSKVSVGRGSCSGLGEQGLTAGFLAAGAVPRMVNSGRGFSQSLQELGQGLRVL